MIKFLKKYKETITIGVLVLILGFLQYLSISQGTETQFKVFSCASTMIVLLYTWFFAREIVDIQNKVNLIDNKAKLGVKVPSVAYLPKYAHKGDAGFDIKAYLPDKAIIIQPRSEEVIPTGLFLEIPDGHEVAIRSRSGLRFKNKVKVFHGTIDSPYKGEVKVILMNRGNQPFVVTDKMRIAQGVLSEVKEGSLNLVMELGDSSRGDKGIGSTGL